MLNVTTYLFYNNTILGFNEDFTKVNQKYCAKTEYGRYSSLNSALEACNEDQNCLLVEDYNCDDTGTFSLCKSPLTIYGYSSTRTCIHMKKGNNQ